MSSEKPSINRHRPEFLHNKPHFTNLIVSEGGKHVYLSGLVASNADGELIGANDLGAQMAFIFDSIRQALATVNATPADIVRQRIFVIDLQLDHRPIIAKAMTEFYGNDGSATSTCVGVPALLVEGALVEIDVTAVIEG